MRTFDVFIDQEPTRGYWRYKVSDGNATLWGDSHFSLKSEAAALAAARSCIEGFWLKYRFDMIINATENERYKKRRKR